MEDIIYILIGIAWIGFSIYSQQKKLKKKQQEAKKARGTDNYQEEEKVEEKETSLFDRLFEEYESGKEYETEVELEPETETYRQPAGVSEKPDWKKYGTVEQVTSKADIVESNSKLSADYYDLGKDKIKNPKIRTEKPDKTYDYDYEYEDIKSMDFDLRSAVIYSAILNRPYD